VKRKGKVLGLKRRPRHIHWPKAPGGNLRRLSTIAEIMWKMAIEKLERR
jgi:hypothetical protein